MDSDARAVANHGRGAADPDLKQRFERTVAALNHPHICTLHDIGSDFLMHGRERAMAVTDAAAEMHAIARDRAASS